MNLRNFAILLLITVALAAGTSCSSRPSGTNENAAATSNSTPDGPSFEILNAWKPNKVMVQGYAISGQPPSRFTLTSKPGSAFVALELQMKSPDPKTPIPNAMWSGTTLLDSKGAQRPMVFSYGASLVKYVPGGDTVEYVGNQDQLGTLSPGEKLVVVFEAPPSDNNLKLEIAKRQTLNVSVK